MSTVTGEVAARLGPGTLWYSTSVYTEKVKFFRFFIKKRDHQTPKSWILVPERDSPTLAFPSNSSIFCLLTMATWNTPFRFENHSLSRTFLSTDAYASPTIDPLPSAEERKSVKLTISGCHLIVVLPLTRKISNEEDNVLFFFISLSLSWRRVPTMTGHKLIGKLRHP